MPKDCAQNGTCLSLACQPSSYACPTSLLSFPWKLRRERRTLHPRPLHRLSNHHERCGATCNRRRLRPKTPASSAQQLPRRTKRATRNATRGPVQRKSAHSKGFAGQRIVLWNLNSQNLCQVQFLGSATEAFEPGLSTYNNVLITHVRRKIFRPKCSRSLVSSILYGGETQSSTLTTV